MASNETEASYPRPKTDSPGYLANQKRQFTMAQKIAGIVIAVMLFAGFFVITSWEEKTVQQKESATGNSSAQFSDPSQLKSELIEDARKQQQMKPAPVRSEPDIPISTPVSTPAPSKPSIIVLQPKQAVIQQRRSAKVTDTQKEEGKRYRNLKETSLTSQSTIEGFQKSSTSTTQTPPVNQMAGVAYANEGLNNLSSSEMQEILAAMGAKQQDSQSKKLDFLTKSGGERTPQGYSENVRMPQLARLELKAGTVIPGLLITGINSDLPGMVIGQVSENVYDTATGNWLLIPQGARLIGAYDSNISFGQKRVGIVWNRLVYPDGSTLNIAGSPGADEAGFSGIKGKVDNHYGQLLVAGVFTSLFTAAVDIASDNDNSRSSNNEKKSARDILVETTATTIANIGAKMADRALDIQPTIVIKPGTRYNVMVQQDIVFPVPWIEPKTRVNGF